MARSANSGAAKRTRKQPAKRTSTKPRKTSPSAARSRSSKSKGRSAKKVDSDVWALPTAITIGDSKELAQSLLRRLDDPDDSVELDGSAIERVDTAGLQLLASFVRECRERELQLKWRGASDTLRECSAALALTAYLELPD